MLAVSTILMKSMENKRTIIRIVNNTAHGNILTYIIKEIIILNDKIKNFIFKLAEFFNIYVGRSL